MYYLLFEKDGRQHEFKNPAWTELRTLAVSINSRGFSGDCGEELSNLFKEFDGGYLKIIMSPTTSHNETVVRSISLGYEIKIETLPYGSKYETKLATDYLLNKGFMIKNSDDNWLYLDSPRTKDKTIETANLILDDFPVKVLCFLQQYIIGDGSTKFGLVQPNVSLRTIKILKNDIFRCKVAIKKNIITTPQTVESALESLGANNIFVSYNDNMYYHLNFDKAYLEDDFSDKFYLAINCPYPARLFMPISIDRESDTLESYKEDGNSYSIIETREDLYDYSGDDSSLDPRFW